MKQYPYSAQAKIMIKNMNIDEKKLQEWFDKHVSIGSGNILEYLIQNNGSK